MTRYMLQYIGTNYVHARDHSAIVCVQNAIYSTQPYGDVNSAAILLKQLFQYRSNNIFFQMSAIFVLYFIILIIVSQLRVI